MSSGVESDAKPLTGSLKDFKLCLAKHFGKRLEARAFVEFTVGLKLQFNNAYHRKLKFEILMLSKMATFKSKTLKFKQRFTYCSRTRLY